MEKLSKVFLNVNEKLDANKYYYYCCAGLGDTMITMGFKHAIEQQLNGEIIFILKESHAFIADMYQDSALIINNFAKKKIERRLTRTPTLGHIYAAHPCLHPEMHKFFNPIYYQTSTLKFLPWFRKFLNIAEDSLMQAPKKYPDLSAQLLDRCQNIAPLNKIILISPEATSMQLFPTWFWEDIVKDLIKQGYQPVSNVINPVNTVAQSTFLKLSSSDAIALGMNCHSVYSVRSGLCDLLYDRGRNLHVYYPSHSSYFLYSLNDMFHRQDIDEQIFIEGNY